MTQGLRHRNPLPGGDARERERLGDGEVLVLGPRGELHGRYQLLGSGERREPVHTRAYLGGERSVELVEALFFFVGKQLDDATPLRAEVVGGAGAKPGQRIE